MSEVLSVDPYLNSAVSGYLASDSLVGPRREQAIESFSSFFVAEVFKDAFKPSQKSSFMNDLLIEEVSKTMIESHALGIYDYMRKEVLENYGAQEEK